MPRTTTLRENTGNFHVIEQEDMVMDYDHFVGLVQSRAHLSSQGDAVAAIRATLSTLAERIDPHEAHHLAAQLPREIGTFLETDISKRGDRFSFGEFCQRVSHREHVDPPAAVHHARCVIETLQEAASPGEIRDVRSQLSEEFAPLFESGSQGRLRRRRGEAPSSGSRRTDATAESGGADSGTDSGLHP
jgi:uncharacterized protein (DUF2267 family)